MPTVALLAVPAHAEDGEQLYRRLGCVVCHGSEGRRPAHPTYPILAGQQRAYLVQQLHDLRSGARDNGSSPLMYEVMRDVGDAEIAALAEYLASRP